MAGFVGAGHHRRALLKQRDNQNNMETMKETYFEEGRRLQRLENEYNSGSWRAALRSRLNGISHSIYGPDAGYTDAQLDAFLGEAADSYGDTFSIITYALCLALEHHIDLGARDGHSLRKVNKILAENREDLSKFANDKYLSKINTCSDQHSPTSYDELRSSILSDLGKVSMAWSEIPQGTFDTEKAIKIADEMMGRIKQYAAQHSKSIEPERTDAGHNFIDTNSANKVIGKPEDNLMNKREQERIAETIRELREAADRIEAGHIEQSGSITIKNGKIFRNGHIIGLISEPYFVGKMPMRTDFDIHGNKVVQKVELATTSKSSPETLPAPESDDSTWAAAGMALVVAAIVGALGSNKATKEVSVKQSDQTVSKI